MKWEPIDRDAQWDCACPDCTGEDESSWTWRLEWNADTRELFIVCREDTGDYRSVRLPEGVALCRAAGENS